MVKTKVKKGSDWNDTKLSKMLNKITDDNFCFIDDFEIELNIKRLNDDFN